MPNLFYLYRKKKKSYKNLSTKIFANMNHHLANTTMDIYVFWIAASKFNLTNTLLDAVKNFLSCLQQTHTI